MESLIRGLRMRVLITRHQQAAKSLENDLKALGFITLLEPLISIEFLKCSIRFENINAVLVTSGNAARALAMATKERNIQIYAVGDATALVLKKQGFLSVASAKGNSIDLLDLVTGCVDPEEGRLLYVSGEEIADDFSKHLIKRGFSFERAVLYRALAANCFSEGVLESLQNNGINVILFFSPRTAEIFVKLIVKFGLTESCSTMSAVCLSKAVACKANHLKWHKVAIAKKPDQVSMITALSELRSAIKSEWK